MSQEEIEKWVTAYHEAGHVIATYHRRLFEFTEPAIKLSSASAGNLAEAGLRGPGRDQWTAAHAREFAMISFGGYVGQTMLEVLRPGWITNQDGCHGDYEKMADALRRFGILHERPDHLSECAKIIHTRIEELNQVAGLIFRSTADIPKADVLAILEPFTVALPVPAPADPPTSKGLLGWPKRLFRRIIAYGKLLIG